MENPTEFLIKQHPDKSPDDGTLHMEHVLQAGFEQPRRFIWDRKLLTNASVKTLNIRTVIQVLESGLQLKEFLDLNAFLSPKDCQADPTKFSYAVLKCVGAFPKVSGLQKRLDAAETADEKERAAEELREAREQLCKELEEFDGLVFKPFNAPALQQPAESVPSQAAQKDEPGPQKTAEPEENTHTRETVPREQDNDLVQEQQREGQYKGWAKEQLIHYILMLEETNASLQKQARELKAASDAYRKEMEPLAAQRDRELLVPNIVRTDQARKAKFLGLW